MLLNSFSLFIYKLLYKEYNTLKIKSVRNSMKGINKDGE